MSCLVTHLRKVYYCVQVGNQDTASLPIVLLAQGSDTTMLSKVTCRLTTFFGGYDIPY